jgi:hypothetical protein
VEVTVPAWAARSAGRSIATSGHIDLYLASVGAPYGPPLPVWMIPNADGAKVLHIRVRMRGQRDTEWGGHQQATPTTGVSVRTGMGSVRRRYRLGQLGWRIRACRRDPAKPLSQFPLVGPSLSEALRATFAEKNWSLRSRGERYGFDLDKVDSSNGSSNE